MTSGNQAVNFATTFSNGWTVSISFLDGSMRRNTNEQVGQVKIAGEIFTTTYHRVETVQVMVFHKETNQDEEIQEGLSTNKIAQIMDEVSRRPDPTEGVETDLQTEIDKIHQALDNILGV